MSDKKDFKYLIRVMNTDLDGSKPIINALSSIKGVGTMFANATCEATGVNSQKKAGQLSDAEVKKINEVLKDPAGFGVPTWLFNRKADPETGDDRHIITADLQFIQSNDKKLQQKIKSYVGTRHSAGLTCRGQRTKSNFRKSKTRGGGSLGVKRKK